MNDGNIIYEEEGTSSDSSSAQRNEASSSEADNNVNTLLPHVITSAPPPGPRIVPGAPGAVQAQPPLSSSAGSSSVMATTDDALVSKFSAVSTGYYNDQALKFFVKAPQRRQPLINRGYYGRVTAIRKIITDFVNASLKECLDRDLSIQIVNIGAGMDPLFYWIHEEVNKVSGGKAGTLLKYYEVDFLEIMRRKTNRIISLGKEELYRPIAPSAADISLSNNGLIVAENWKMIGCDLRNMTSVDAEFKALNFNPEFPTLFLIECVLSYLTTGSADNIISWCSTLTTSAPSVFVNFEPFNPHDKFGDMMVRNLQTRGCPLLSINDYPTLQTLHKRFLDLGWQSCSIADMNAIYDSHLDRSDILRIEHLELFDEIEEWRLIQAHYYISVSLRGTTPKTLSQTHSPKIESYSPSAVHQIQQASTTSTFLAQSPHAPSVPRISASLQTTSTIPSFRTSVTSPAAAQPAGPGSLTPRGVSGTSHGLSVGGSMGSLFSTSAATSGLRVCDEPHLADTEKTRMFKFLSSLVDYWTSGARVELPRFTTEQAKSSSHKDLVDLAQRMLSGDRSFGDQSSVSASVSRAGSRELVQPTKKDEVVVQEPLTLLKGGREFMKKKSSLSKSFESIVDEDEEINDVDDELSFKMTADIKKDEKK